jgi:DNA-binding NtrC family response regulator
MQPEQCSKNRVWIVDDEKELADTYAEYLVDDFTTTVFSSPQNALAAWENDPTGPDLLVSDLKMPGTDGLSLVRKIREKDETKPILMISGYADKGHILRAQALRVETFLEKPFEPENLRNEIKRLLKMQSEKSLEKTLVGLLLKERAQYEKLLSAYLARLAAAENLAADAGLLFQGKQEDKAAFMNTLYAENHLHQELDQIRTKIAATMKEREALT